MSTTSLDLHPWQPWEEELPTIEIDTHTSEPSNDPFFWIDDGFGIPEIVITNAQLLQKRMDELADQSSW